MESTLFLSKNEYSESVIRKSLYWLSESHSWSLESDEERWIVCFDNPSADVVSELFRLLNDFKLREQLDASTKHLRLELIRSALHEIANKYR